MKHTFAVFAVLAGAGITFAQTPATKIAPSKGWLNDLNAGRALAQKTGKPLMVVFRCDP
jgi:hypothetical protein